MIAMNNDLEDKVEKLILVSNALAQSVKLLIEKVETQDLQIKSLRELCISQTKAIINLGEMIKN
jgi:hypothetical protein